MALGSVSLLLQWFLKLNIHEWCLSLMGWPRNHRLNCLKSCRRVSGQCQRFKTHWKTKLTDAHQRPNVGEQPSICRVSHRPNTSAPRFLGTANTPLTFLTEIQWKGNNGRICLVEYFTNSSLCLPPFLSLLPTLKHFRVKKYMQSAILMFCWHLFDFFDDIVRLCDKDTVSCDCFTVKATRSLVVGSFKVWSTARDGGSTQTQNSCKTASTCLKKVLQ